MLWACGSGRWQACLRPPHRAKVYVLALGTHEPALPHFLVDVLKAQGLAGTSTAQVLFNCLLLLLISPLILCNFLFSLKIWLIVQALTSKQAVIMTPSFLGCSCLSFNHHLNIMKCFTDLIVQIRKQRKQWPLIKATWSVSNRSEI